ncbi:hypothetical protein Tco_0704749 [Tanacetum coccineum]|uniref:Uncharacterized protein n=1 Tax=Tanacetum coccineum TaxID=301880 RepID=A0ABQ4Y2M4_9ASTR
MPKCMAWLDDKPIGDMEDKVDNPSPQSTPQVLLSIEVYKPPVTHPREVEETIGILMEVGPSNHMKLEDLGLNTNTRDIFLSSKGFSSVDEPEPQLLPKFSPLDVNLGDKRGTDPPINLYSSGSFRMKEITNGNLRTRIFEEKKKNSLQTLETASGLILTQSPGLPQENLIFNSVSWIGMNRKAYLLEDKQIPSVESHMDIALRVLKYLKGASGYGVEYKKSEHMSLKIYADSDLAKCLVTRRSVLGFYVFFNGCLVS